MGMSENNFAHLIVIIYPFKNIITIESNVYVLSSLFINLVV